MRKDHFNGAWTTLLGGPTDADASLVLPAQPSRHGMSEAILYRLVAGLRLLYSVQQIGASEARS